MDYHQFESELNEGKIKEAHFSIEGYGHYRDCAVFYTPLPKDTESIFLPSIEFRLTHDGKEKMIFTKRFKGDAKIFYIKGIGRCSLRYIWKRVNIKSIEYFE